jgi:hypothetical protein
MVYAEGWPACIKTAPTPLAQVLVSIQKGLEKSGVAKTRAETRASFRASKAAW